MCNYFECVLWTSDVPWEALGFGTTSTTNRETYAAAMLHNRNEEYVIVGPPSASNLQLISMFLHVDSAECCWEIRA